jgi:hypothetical protein
MKKNNSSFIYIAVLLVMTMSAGLRAEVATTLDDLLKPDALFADKTQLYVGEGANVFIYSLNDYSKIKQFGKEGEGPKEFKVKQFIPLSLFIDTQSDQLIISSLNKVSFFSKSGDFIKEQKVRSNFSMPNFKLLGKHMVRSGYARRDKVNFSTLVLYDAQLNKVKEVFSAKSTFQRGGKMNPLRRPTQYAADTAANRLFVAPGDGKIYVFNEQGNQTITITPKMEKIRLTDDHKNSIYEYYQTDPRMKRFWNFMKERIEMPSDLPLIHYIKASDAHIYVVTYQRREDSVRVLVYDKTGKLTADAFPAFHYKNFIEAFPFTIKNNKLYQLVENDDEEWELHVTPI